MEVPDEETFYSDNVENCNRMNIVEQMMVEHVAIRVQLKLVRESANASDSVYELDEFVIRCHARIEDELLFPRLRAMLPSEKEVETLSRIEADHLLIAKISERIRNATENGESDILRKRIMLYCTTVESHNLAEENSIFPYWDSREKISSKKIIDEFGRERYFKITGVSEKLFESYD